MAYADNGREIEITTAEEENLPYTDNGSIESGSDVYDDLGYQFGRVEKRNHNLADFFSVTQLVMAI